MFWCEWLHLALPLCYETIETTLEYVYTLYAYICISVSTHTCAYVEYATALLVFLQHMHAETKNIPILEKAVLYY